MIKAYVLGNGESRKEVDLDRLRAKGKVWGCNALYRDWTPDNLVAVDHGIMHEIYWSGYARYNRCYFRKWFKHPIDDFNKTINCGMNTDKVNYLKSFNTIKENTRTDNTNSFVIHGTQLNSLDRLIQKYGRDKRKLQQINDHELTISYCDDDDKSENLDDHMTPRDLGWAAGPTAMYLASKYEGANEIYLVGFDLYSNTNNINNIYKGTKNYAVATNAATPSQNWIGQMAMVFKKYPSITYYKVNKNTDDLAINDEVPEWRNIPNLKYKVIKDL